MPKRRPQEEVKHERWLVSYSDFITLLFAFFVVMYSISQVSESKYRVLSETLNSAFDPSSEAAKVPLTLKPIEIGHPERHSEPSVLPDGGDGDAQLSHEAGFHEAGFHEAGFHKSTLGSLSDLFEQEFADLIHQELVEVHGNELWLEIELKSSILFDSADAQPSFQAQEIFAEMAGILKRYDNDIRVEGFTDNVPIATQRFPSNWELSSARAVTIVKLLADAGVSPQRLSAVGYGAFQPITDNDTEAGRSANRRVVLMVARGDHDSRGVSIEQPAANTVQASTLQKSTLQKSNTNTAQESKIEPVELGGGGWLFSSNPELPRSPN